MLPRRDEGVCDICHISAKYLALLSRGVSAADPDSLCLRSKGQIRGGAPGKENYEL